MGSGGNGYALLGRCVGRSVAADPASQAVSGPAQPGTDHSTAVQALRHKPRLLVAGAAARAGVEHRVDLAQGIR
jgi:hypothetical protein